MLLRLLRCNDKYEFREGRSLWRFHRHCQKEAVQIHQRKIISKQESPRNRHAKVKAPAVTYPVDLVLAMQMKAVLSISTSRQMVSVAG
jgi:hypothetical protein